MSFKKRKNRTTNKAAGSIPRLTAKQWELIQIINEEGCLSYDDERGTARVINALIQPGKGRPYPMIWYDSPKDSYYLTDDGLQAYNRKLLHSVKVNTLNQEFIDAWELYGDDRFEGVAEYQGIEGRNFKFDYAFPKQKVAVELQGGVYGRGKERGSHIRITGYERDCEKNNLACAQGWRVLAFTSGMLSRDKLGCIQLVTRTLELAQRSKAEEQPKE